METQIYKSFMVVPYVCDIIYSEIPRKNVYGKIHSLREAFQKGKAKDGYGPASDLGRTEPRYPEAREQQGIQQKKVTGLEAGITASTILRLFLFYGIKMWHFTPFRGTA